MKQARAELHLIQEHQINLFEENEVLFFDSQPIDNGKVKEDDKRMTIEEKKALHDKHPE